VSDWRIPLTDIDYGPEEEAAALRVLRSRWLSMGPEVRAFEIEFAAMQGAKHAVAVANATAGLHLCFLALGLGPGDEVIQPALNFVAAANMTVAIGATPVFADIAGLEDPTIDPRHTESLISTRTKAVVVMHYGGALCHMPELMGICQQHKLALVEDSCHAVGVAYRHPSHCPPHGVMAGSMGDISAFSFFSNKNLATGEGGMVVTNRDDLADRVGLLRSHGMTTLTWDRHKGHASSYEVVANGYNYRMDEMRAALGRVQLEKLSRNNDRRRCLLALYRQRLQNLAGWILPYADRAANTSGHLMTALAPSRAARQSVADRLRECGVQTSLHYPCIADFEAFARWRREPLSKTRDFASRVLTLPLYPNLKESQVAEVCDLIYHASA
jgi:dTDP-4-amino-4,6-dideoxygalactose transaminase